LRQELARLGALLEDSDGEALGLAEHLRAAARGTALEASFDEVYGLIEGFQFAAALEALKEIAPVD